MRKMVFLAAIVVLVLGLTATAAYADRATGNSIGPSMGPGQPTVIAPDDFPQLLPNGGTGWVNNGASWFWYADLQDSYAKNEGGYAAFTTTGIPSGSVYSTPGLIPATNDYWVPTASTGGIYDVNLGGTGGVGPHGGYATNSNKCKVCHAVHRAEGAYYLLRADSEGDACDYCHIGGGAHSDMIVYDLNPAGTDTTNGHTIGASTSVPDSSVDQTAQPVVISGVDANMNMISTTINVRVYDSQRINMYRFSRHHSQNGAGTSGTTSTFKLVGPTSLSCLSCHQQHQAPAMLWQPSGFDPAFTEDVVGGNPQGTKLLKRYPSGSYSAFTVSGGDNWVALADAVAVPETTLTAGTNFSTTASNQNTFTLSDGTIARQPTWIAQGWNFKGTDDAEVAFAATAADPTAVNENALSVWCADCHNLDIGGYQNTTVELGFRAHTERTHPAPFQGAGAGAGQCYSCHRNDLSVMVGTDDPSGYGMNQVAGGTADACSQCHYGTGNYASDNTNRETDFPHSGTPNDIKLLGAYSVGAVATTDTAWAASFTALTVAETNLDAVCLRCHPGIGVNN
jgi:hypothetical protein